MYMNKFEKSAVLFPKNFYYTYIYIYIYIYALLSSWIIGTVGITLKLIIVEKKKNIKCYKIIKNIKCYEIIKENTGFMNYEEYIEQKN